MKQRGNKNNFEKIFHKIRFAFSIIKEYKNWYLVFLDYFGLIKNKLLIYKLKTGAKYFSRAGTTDFEIINEIYVVKEYHKLLEYLGKGSVVIDIGAQMGVFSIFSALRDSSIKVYSYEPFLPNYNLLKKNIQLNNLSKQVIPLNLGVGKKSEKRNFTVSDKNTGGHGFYCTDSSEKIQIKTISLKEVFEKNKIKKCDFLKMDCEGAEYEIFFNTPDSYLKKIRSITMEYHNNGDVAGLKIFLEKSGFVVEVIGAADGLLYAYRK